MREDYLVVGVMAMMIGAGAAAYGLTFQGDLTGMTWLNRPRNPGLSRAPSSEKVGTNDGKGARLTANSR